jgi:hypothetical protein
MIRNENRRIFDEIPTEIRRALTKEFFGNFDEKTSE